MAAVIDRRTANIIANAFGADGITDPLQWLESKAQERALRQTLEHLGYDAMLTDHLGSSAPRLRVTGGAWIAKPDILVLIQAGNGCARQVYIEVKNEKSLDRYNGFFYDADRLDREIEFNSNVAPLVIAFRDKKNGQWLFWSVARIAYARETGELVCRNVNNGRSRRYFLDKAEAVGLDQLRTMIDGEDLAFEVWHSIGGSNYLDRRADAPPHAQPMPRTAPQQILWSVLP